VRQLITVIRRWFAPRPELPAAVRDADTLWKYATLAVLAFFFAFGLGCGVIGWKIGRQPAPVPVSIKAAIAHLETTRKAASAAVDTFTHRDAIAQHAHAGIVVRHDTVWVDSEPPVISLRLAGLISSQDSALSSARVLPAALSAVETSCDGSLAAAMGELHDAWKKARPPRVTAEASVLYEPIAQIPVARLGAGVRLFSDVRLMAEGEQRFVPGEAPRVRVGVRIGWSL
jgi:hypothetical protein